MNKLITDHIEQSISVKSDILNSPAILGAIQSAAEACKNALNQGNKIILAGNGGSAADSQHIAAELSGRFEKERDGLAAVAITTDTSALTAIANDYGYEKVFSRQLEAIAASGDVFIGISTSGNSKNIIEAVNSAQKKNVTCISLGGKAGKLPDLCEHAICVPCDRTATIQESHIMIGHILCALIEEA